MQVIKRDGEKVEFDKQKIVAAIIKAFRERYKTADGEMMSCAEKIANEIETISKDKELDVEEIQDIVEKKLMATKYKDVAKAYTNYRYLHSMARDKYKDLMDSVSEKLSARNVQNQNANVDEASFGGRIGEAADVVTKKFALEYLVSPMARANHENNEIYIHDLNAYAVGSHNCLSIPFDDLLANGFNTRQTDVRPAQSINTAFQLVAVIFQIQSLQQFGGVSATHLDWTMVPYVRKSFFKHYKDGLKYIANISPLIIEQFVETEHISPEMSIDDKNYINFDSRVYQYAMEMTTNECKQAVEGMYHNLKHLGIVNGNVTMNLA